MRVPGISGEKVRLVPLEKEHLENCLKWLNDSEVMRWTKRVIPLHRAQEDKFLERMVESRDDVAWAIHDENDRHIGVSGIHRIDWQYRSGMTGTIIGEKSAWGRGYGSDTMRTRTRWAFEELGLHRLQSGCFVENEASKRCLEKAGFRVVGTLRKRIWRAAAWHDLYLMEILEEDWFARKTVGSSAG